MPAAARRTGPLASIAARACAVAVPVVAAVATSAASSEAARSGDFDVQLVAWKLSINYAPYLESTGARGGKLGYCASIGDDGLTVQLAWNGAGRGQAFTYLLRGPHGAAVFKRGRFRTRPWSTSGSASVTFQNRRRGDWAPEGRYKFSFASDGRTLIGSTLKLVANSC